MYPTVRRQAPASRPGPATPVQPRGAGNRPAIVASALVLAMGVWLMITAFLWERGFVGGFGANWNDLLVGTALAILGVFRILMPAHTRPLGVANILLGLWLIAAPFVLDYTGAEATAATWNNGIVGAIVAVLATVSVAASAAHRPT